MTDTKLTIPEVVARFAAYAVGRPEWGSLHIVLADGNVRDKDCEFCASHAERNGDTEGAELARILLRMSKTQRWKMSEMARRITPAQSPPAPASEAASAEGT